MQDTTTTTSASAVFRQLRAAPVDAASHAAQLDLVRQLVQGKLELHLPRKARARALLEWAAGRCAAKDGPNTPSSILDPEYWNLFSQILSLKDDSSIPSVSSSAASIHSEEASNLLSKSDIRQIVLLSRGISLLNALKTCLESIASFLAEGESIPTQQPGDSSSRSALLLKYLHLVFARLFPLSLSSPNTTLDGLLPCIHAFVRSSSSIITSSSLTIPPQWTQIGQLLLTTLSSLLKISSSNVQSATASDKLLLRKVASSFLDQPGAYFNWKSFMISYSIISQLSHGHDETAPSSKGKGKARAQQQESTLISSSTIAGVTASKSAEIKLLLDVFDSFITTSVLSPANLARYFSISSGGTLDTPKQAQDALSELFTALKASLRDTSSTSIASSISSSTLISSSSSNVSTSTIHVLPRLVRSYIDTLTSHSHDLFAPLRRGGRPSTDTTAISTSGTSTGASNAGASSRSAVEYQVQTSFRNAVFGMLQGCVQLLKDASASTSSLVADSNDKSTSPRKRQRDASNANASGPSSSVAVAGALRLILSQIQKRNIYITGGGVANRAWHKILQDTAQFAVEDLLSNPTKGGDETDATVVAAMQAITHIAEMDYTALENVLPAILKAMAHNITTSKQEAYTQSCNDLMESALSYNGKIRQLPTFITKIEEAISSMIDEAASQSEDNDAVAFGGSMDSLFRSPLLSRHTSARLSKECKASLGATQALPLLKSLLEKINTLVIQVQQENQEATASAQPPKKKSKQGRALLSGAIASSSVPQEAVARKICAVSQVVQAILASGILTQAAASAPPSVEYAEVNSEFAALQDSQMELLEGITGKNTATQRTEIALLQVCDAWRAAQEEETGAGNTANDGEMLNVFTESKKLTPSLTFEIIRSLLSRLASSASESQAEGAHKLFNHIASILASATQDSKAWDGHLHDLAESDLPTAVWWLVATKYMDVAEQSASEAQLDDIVKFIFRHRANLPNAHSNEVSIPTVTGRLLRSADFYELQRVRAAIAKYVNVSCESAELGQNNLEILLLLPKEYLDRSTKRKIVTTLSGQSNSLGDINTILALLKYTRDDPGNPLIKDLNFLKQSIEYNTVESSNHTTQLYEHLWSLMLQNWSASPERFTGLPDLLDSLKSRTNGNSDTLRFATWRILAAEAKASSVPPQVLDDLKTRVKSLQADTQVDHASVARTQQQLQASITVQIVTRWLQTADSVDSQISPVNEDNAQLAKTAVASLLQHAEGSEQDLNSTLYLALELASMNLPSKLLDFEAFVVIFWLLAQKFGLQESRFNTLLAKTCSAQSEEAYQSAVSTISEAVSPNVNPQALASTLQTLGVLLCNPPETATRVASQAFSATLRRVTLLKAGLSLSSLSAVALEAITSFIKAFLEQRIGVPEVHDVAAIWSILHDILTAGTSSAMTATPHLSSTATNIFLSSIDIVSLLATHRRDHIIPTFPQFCRILSDILQLLRLSGISSSSSTIATAAHFPAWSLVHHGSWIQESKCGKAVARLLLGLGTRTTVLQRSSARSKGAASASVVSLAGPMSKHAPFILVNYLTSATDSRFAMSPSMRKEINPGILEILSTMGKSEREALMKGYLHDDQEAERVLLRVMWKEFDSVRYKGD